MPLIDWLRSCIRPLWRERHQSRRFTKCPKNGMTIPLVGEIEHPSNHDLDLELYWCYCCPFGVAYFRNGRHDSAACDYSWNGQRRSWELDHPHQALDAGSVIRFLNSLAPNGEMPEQYPPYH